jgi:hypothetical protein
VNLESITRYLASKGNVSLTSGALPRVFMSEKPNNANVGTAYSIIYTDARGASVDEYLPNYHKVKLQVVVSAEMHDEGFDLGKAISNDLAVNGKTLSDIYIVKCSPTTLPIPFGRNEQDLIEFSITFNLIFRNLEV